MSDLDQFSEEFSGITALLAARHDALTVLKAVTGACGTVLSADATGILVRDPRGGLVVVDASEQAARFTEFLQAHLGEGPCVDCIDRDEIVHSDDLGTEQRWPRLVAEARDAGYRAVYAFPLRLVDHAIGGLNLFFTAPTVLSSDQRTRAQALADLAVLGLTQERDQRRIVRLAERTMTTLNDRARVQQAAGILAEALDIRPDAALAALGSYSDHSGDELLTVADKIIGGELESGSFGPFTR
ncbi:GAF domain-containing protein [Amycolatopsis japonica]|uniref:GAF domain-containing protein n=1 Tax=Amycolatopsis japonica TaxID=208439 RepID=UPI00332F8498